MSDIFENIHILGSRGKPACRVTYTLNNTQPVRCTIIGDQPLFYLDCEDEIIDDGHILDPSDLAFLEGEIATLKTEIDTFDKFSEGFIQSPEQSFENFLADKMIITGEAEEFAGDISMEALKTILSKSRLAQAYIEFAAQHGVSMTFCAQVETGQYDRRSGLIQINPHLHLADQILVAARELRRHWQHRQGALINPLVFHPDNAVLINRAQVADLSVSMIRISWELQLSGIKDAWERLENSSMGDLGRAFAREAFLDFRTLNNGHASAMVFESWFLSERCRNEDKKLIKQMLADYQGYVFDLSKMGEAVTPALIAALGSMPYGKNYLSGHAATIMGDPVFTEVRDRSNANFLWFIKFERSFRETEQELQPEFELAAEGVRRQATHIESQVVSHEQQTAEIVSLFPTESTERTGDKSAKRGKILKSSSVNRKRAKNKHSAEIVYLQRWSGE